MNTGETEREKKKQGKNFKLKTRYQSLEFSDERNIHNSCDIPHFCSNYLANRRTTHNVLFSSAD